jgi:hypothetical protein
MPGLEISRRAALAAVALSAFPKISAANPLVDLGLVLAIDCSFSVNEEAYHLQMQGFAAAFMDAEIHKLILKGYHKRIAIAAFHWSDPDTQRIVLPWRILGGASDAIAVGQVFANAVRQIEVGATATGSALLYALNLFEEAPAATRQVVDISTDGSSNSGYAAPKSRDDLVAGGITINALAILDEEPHLASYLERDVIGGDGAFIVTAKDFKAFGAAIREKLIREISNSASS